MGSYSASPIKAWKTLLSVSQSSRRQVVLADTHGCPLAGVQMSQELSAQLCPAPRGSGARSSRRTSSASAMWETGQLSPSLCAFTGVFLTTENGWHVKGVAPAPGLQATSCGPSAGSSWPSCPHSVPILGAVGAQPAARLLFLAESPQRPRLGALVDSLRAKRCRAAGHVGHWVAPLMAPPLSQDPQPSQAHSFLPLKG